MTVKKDHETLAKRLEWMPILYVAGQTPRSVAAFTNLERVLVGLDLRSAQAARAAK